MINIQIEDFPEYSIYPERGKFVHSDSSVFDLEFTNDSIDHRVKLLLNIEYERYYEPSDGSLPDEDSTEILSTDYVLIRAWKYLHDDEIEIVDPKEFRRIDRYITENLNIQ